MTYMESGMTAVVRFWLVSFFEQARLGCIVVTNHYIHLVSCRCQVGAIDGG